MPQPSSRCQQIPAAFSPCGFFSADLMHTFPMRICISRFRAHFPHFPHADFHYLLLPTLSATHLNTVMHTWPLAVKASNRLASIYPWASCDKPSAALCFQQALSPSMSVTFCFVAMHMACRARWDARGAPLSGSYVALMDYTIKTHKLDVYQ